MEQRLSIVTLGVQDLERSVGFYHGLGWTPANDWRVQEVAFFQMPGCIFGLWRLADLAADSGTSPDSRPGAVTLAYNARTREDVDRALDDARAAGGVIVRDGAETFWGGYSGVFHDPDGHAWEVAHNPGWTIADDGSIRIV